MSARTSSKDRAAIPGLRGDDETLGPDLPSPWTSAKINQGTALRGESNRRPPGYATCGPARGLRRRGEAGGFCLKGGAGGDTMGGRDATSCTTFPAGSGQRYVQGT